MALNPAGDRVLTVGTDDWVQLWTRDGRLIAEVQAPDESIYTPTGSALFAGDAAVALTGHANLVVLDAATGSIRVRVRHELVFPRLLQALDDHHVLVEGDSPHVLAHWLSVIDVRDGRIVHQVEMRPEHLRTVRSWAIGRTGRQIAPDRWDSYIHLATPTLEPVPIDRACALLGPLPMCVHYDPQTGVVHRFDAVTRSWAAFDLGAAAAGHELGSWLQVGGRLIVFLCRTVEPWRPDTRTCKAIDVEAGRVLYAFAGPGHHALATIGEDGSPEIRLAVTPVDLNDGVRIRRIGLDGQVTTIARPRPGTEFAMALPDGGMLIQDPLDREGSLLLSASGRVRARIKVEAGACRNLHIDMVTPYCIVSDDRRTLAVMSGTVRLFRLPARQGD